MIENSYTFPTSEDPLHDSIFYTLRLIDEKDEEFIRKEALLNLFSNMTDEELIDALPACLPSLAADIELLKGLLSARDCLAILMDKLDRTVDVYDLKDISIRTVKSLNSDEFLGLQYLVVADIIENDMKEALNTESKDVVDALFRGSSADQLPNYLVSIEASNEIQRVRDHPEFGEKLNKWHEKVTANIDRYLESALPGIVFESIRIVYYEAILKSVPELFKLQGYSVDDYQEIQAKLLKDIKAKTNQSISIRLGIKRGPKKRFRESSVWNEEIKAQYWLQYDSIPRVNGVPLWKHIFTKLEESEFSEESENELVRQLAYLKVPKELIQEARERWRGFERPSQIKNVEHQVRAFAERHALYLLGITTYFGSNTLRQYRSKGKKYFNSLSASKKQEIRGSITPL